MLHTGLAAALKNVAEADQVIELLSTDFATGSRFRLEGETLTRA